MMKHNALLAALILAGYGLLNTPLTMADEMLTSSTTLVQAKSAPADLTYLLALAIQHDANWQSTQFTAEAQKETYAQARSQLLPQLQYSVQTTSNEDRGSNFLGIGGKYNSNSQSIRLTQPLFRLDAWFGFKRAKAQYDQVNSELKAEYQALIIKVATAYFDWLKAEAQLNFSNAEEQAYQKQKEQAQLNFKAGLSALTDVYEVQAEADLAHARQIAARNQLALAKKNMQAMTSIAIDAVTTPEAPKISHATSMTFTDWVNFAKANNPNYRAAQQAVEAAQQTKRAQISAYGPQIDLVSSYTDGKNSTISTQPSERKSSQIGLQLSLPLWTSGQTTSRYRQANNQLHAADAHLNAVANDAAVKIGELLDQMKADQDILEAQQQAKKSSQLALTATQAGYRAGTRTIVDVLQAQSKQLSSAKDYQLAVYDALLHQLQFEQVIGRLSAETIAQLSTQK